MLERNLLKLYLRNNPENVTRQKESCILKKNSWIHFDNQSKTLAIPRLLVGKKTKEIDTTEKFSVKAKVRVARITLTGSQFYFRQSSVEWSIKGMRREYKIYGYFNSSDIELYMGKKTKMKMAGQKL